MGTITFPVEASHIMMFARAVGDTNPVYHDAQAAKKTEAGGIIAPPPSARRWRSSTPTTTCARNRASPGSAPAKPPPAWTRQPSAGGLHAEQHFEYHRPLRPGDVLTAETKPGKTWEKESKRAGKLTFRERITEYRDAAGELVLTARGVGVTTERPVDQG